MSALASNVVPLHAAPPVLKSIVLEIPLTGKSLAEVFFRIQTAAELCGVIVNKADSYGAQAVTMGLSDVLQALQASILSL